MSNLCVLPPETLILGTQLALNSLAKYGHRVPSEKKYTTGIPGSKLSGVHPHSQGMESGPRKDTNCATHPYPCNHEVALSVSPTNRMLQILNSLVQAKPYTRVSRGNQSKVHSFEKKSENSFPRSLPSPDILIVIQHRDISDISTTNS